MIIKFESTGSEQLRQAKTRKWVVTPEEEEEEEEERRRRRRRRKW
jgi:hypothetical protein